MFDRRRGRRRGRGAAWARRADLRAGWLAEIGQVLADATAGPAGRHAFRSTGTQGVHSEHMGFMLAEMQSLQRSYPGGAW
jgi:ring-1,2-phenylacetyl-CoA epoxidase subunit PaaC